jgi:hypothetical protein
MTMNDEELALDADYIADHLTRWFTHKNGGILVDFTVVWMGVEDAQHGVVISWTGGPSAQEVKDWGIAAGLLTGDMAFVLCDRRDGDVAGLRDVRG